MVLFWAAFIGSSVVTTGEETPYKSLQIVLT
jgi:hypothetical protein